jgi:hypothetical protein
VRADLSAENIVFLASASQLAVDPLVNCGSPESPQFAYLNTRYLPSKHHALERARMNSKHSSGGVTIQ